MTTNKTAKFLSLFLFLIWPGCSNAEIIPVLPASPVLATSTFQPIETPSSTPWPTPTFLIPSATEIVIVEKQPNPNEWITFDGNEEVQLGEVHDIAFGADGSVWFASGSGGLTKYKDGEWKSYDPGSDYFIWKVTVTGKNVVYVIAELVDDRIVGRFDGKNWTWWPDVTVAIVSEFVTTPDNQLWISLHDGVMELDGNNWTYKDMKYPVTAFSPDGIMWSNGYRFMKNGEWTEVPYSSEYFLPGLQRGESFQGRLVFVNFGLENSMWYKIINYGFVHVYENGTFDFYKTLEHTDPNTIQNGLVSEDGTFWFSGLDGIFCFDGKTWNRINYGHSIRNDHSIIFSMKKSPNGEIWFGGVKEIFRYSPQK